MPATMPLLIVGCILLGLSLWSGLCAVTSNEARDRAAAAALLAIGLLLILLAR